MQNSQCKVGIKKRQQFLNTKRKKENINAYPGVQQVRIKFRYQLKWSNNAQEMKGNKGKKKNKNESKQNSEKNDKIENQDETSSSSIPKCIQEKESKIVLNVQARHPIFLIIF